MPGPLSADAGAILKAWERDCDKLLTGVDGSPAGAARVIQAMLTRFAHSVSEARAGRISSSPPMVLAEKGPQAGGSYRTAAMRRYIRLIGADLTALLRIDLAQWGLREPTHYLDYATARSILLPLANLDATFEELGQHFAAPGPSAVPPRPADTLRTGTRLA
jgi:hypothetical protein